MTSRVAFARFSCPSPHGEGGLKSSASGQTSSGSESLPAWGGWIEIQPGGGTYRHPMSLPAWGGWIEIPPWFYGYGMRGVPPRMGRVD